MTVGLVFRPHFNEFTLHCAVIVTIIQTYTSDILKLQ